MIILIKNGSVKKSNNIIKDKIIIIIKIILNSSEK